MHGVCEMLISNQWLINMCSTLSKAHGTFDLGQEYSRLNLFYARGTTVRTRTQFRRRKPLRVAQVNWVVSGARDGNGWDHQARKLQSICIYYTIASVCSVFKWATRVNEFAKRRLGVDFMWNGFWFLRRSTQSKMHQFQVLLLFIDVLQRLNVAIFADPLARETIWTRNDLRLAFHDDWRTNLHFSIQLRFCHLEQKPLLGRIVINLSLSRTDTDTQTFTGIHTHGMLLLFPLLILLFAQ